MSSFVDITLIFNDEASTDSRDCNDLRSGCNKMPRKACFAGVPANFRLGLVEIYKMVFHGPAMVGGSFYGSRF